MSKLTYTCKTCGDKFQAWPTEGYVNCPYCRNSSRVKRASIQCPTCKKWREVSLEHKNRLKGKLTECSTCLAITRSALLVAGRKISNPKPQRSDEVKVKRIVVPCGEMHKAREGNRCDGYRIHGGCEHYMDCIDLAIDAGWSGWKVTSAL